MKEMDRSKTLKTLSKMCIIKLCMNHTRPRIHTTYSLYNHTGRNKYHNKLKYTINKLKYTKINKFIHLANLKFHNVRKISNFTSDEN